MAAALLGGASVSTPVSADELDGRIDEIVAEGTSQSEVMLLAHELMDGIGGRLTNSPALHRAQGWAADKFAGWGLTNIHTEPFLFGPGWSFDNAYAQMIEPRHVDMTMIPVAWTPGTAEPIRAEIVVAPMSKPEHFDEWRGKLSGKIVLVSLPGTGDEPTRPAFRRLESKDIAERDRFEEETYDPDEANRRLERVRNPMLLDEFLAAEGALAWVKKSYRDGKLVHGSGYTHWPDLQPSLPAFELAAEDYRRLARLAKTGTPPTIEVYSDARFHDEDLEAENLFAEIPGTDRSAGYVMAGAHFDSWVAGDGAVDNGAGSVAIMEAARILSQLGVRPKRTIRFALWSGEEQGLHGSLAYVRAHLADRAAVPGDLIEDRYGWRYRWPLEKKPGHDDLKAYFNIDNGSGRLRGIYAEGNLAAARLLKSWLSPFAPLGAEQVVTSDTSGTDHVYMQAVGAPAFQFVQDPLDYGSRLHHTSADTLDHMRPEDMRQMSVVLAGMLYQAAMSDEELPRVPFPAEPNRTDPFAYDDPDED
ncbi:peptidase M28 [Pacificimonas flava]|uniref:Carboxypeptidase Q n=2 Tax=Pacificimonas TaxID=1960290 RepID=A0A219BA48_9SPHN|nr:M20/M25/M40 family metallo-hydrolase [Pacificimonas flava]MBZ6377231.1 M20/M25/M40 family metallo-hydrolase [Pacificimonas aurantium]OWV34658.1 peptidase M28 [Pacificimonas flava]